MTSRWTLVAALAASALLLSGCTDADPQPPQSTPAPTTTQGPVAPQASLAAAWLDDGRAFALVTYGSSSCVPVVSDVGADGQNVTVTLTEEEAEACTDDYVPRAALVGLPEGVDPTRDVDVTVRDESGGTESRVELDGDDDLSGAGLSDFQASAGWFSDRGIVLLTWGSGSCVPVVESVDERADSATVTFVESPADRVCTADMRARTTVLELSAEPDDDDDFTLILAGDGFEDHRVGVIGD